jgi:hypothetical protein
MNSSADPLARARDRTLNTRPMSLEVDTLLGKPRIVTEAIQPRSRLQSDAYPPQRTRLQSDAAAQRPQQLQPRLRVQSDASQLQFSRNRSDSVQPKPFGSEAGRRPSEGLRAYHEGNLSRASALRNSKLNQFRSSQMGKSSMSGSVRRAERKLPEWARIQSRTLASWADHKMRDRKVQIRDIFQDFITGVNLILLIEELEQEPFTIP